MKLTCACRAEMEVPDANPQPWYRCPACGNVLAVPGSFDCPNCGSRLAPGARFCLKCGSQLTAPTAIGKPEGSCRVCGAPMAVGIEKCRKCGEVAREEPRGACPARTSSRTRLLIFVLAVLVLAGIGLAVIHFR